MSNTTDFKWTTELVDVLKKYFGNDAQVEKIMSKLAPMQPEDKYFAAPGYSSPAKKQDDAAKLG